MRRTEIKAVCNYGCFYFANEDPLFSSGRKTLFRGEFRSQDDIGLDALIAIFSPNHAEYYASELACLARNAILGVGPRLLASYAELPPKYDGLALIEEDVGISLEEAVLRGCPIPDNEGRAWPLHSIGTPERTAESEKIIFDILVQLSNMHERGVFHRDLRLANVCVKRHGDEPENIRATLVDFELSSDNRTSSIAYCNEPYPHLFCKLTGEGDRGYVAGSHTSLEIDLGYLTALQFELITGLPVSKSTASDLRAVYDDWPLFGYREDGSIFSRTIDFEIDIEPKALSLGLTRVDKGAFPDPKMLSLALKTIRHGGFADAYDLRYLSSRVPESQIYGSLADLARDAFATYLEQVRENGLEAKYKTVESQPTELLESTNAQVRDIPNKVYALGYSLARFEEASKRERIDEFTLDEVEYLSFLEHRRWCEERNRAGWRYGLIKNVEQRISDCLIPYNQLSEETKEYDREHVRSIPEYLRSIGLAIIR